MKTTTSLLLGSSFLLFSFLTGGCISIDIQPKEFSMADQIQFQEPAKPFAKSFSPNSDKTWESGKTKNIITYVSECGAVSNLSLKSIAQSVLAPTQMKVESQTFSEREKNSVLTTIAAQQDEKDKTKKRLKLVTEKTPNCIFNFAYLAEEESYSEEVSLFDRFVQDFKVQ